MLVPKRSIAAALVTLSLGASCTNLGHVKAVKTADRLGDLSVALDDLRARVTASAATLAALVAARDQDPGPAFAQFENSIGALASSQKRADQRLQGVREYADAYFLAWKEQAATIGDEDLKERSEERRNELSAAVEEVADEMGPVQEEITAYLSSLEDTLKYLSIDLTPQGISAIDGRAKDAAKTSKGLGDRLGEVLETVQRAAPQFAKARASTPRKGPGAPNSAMN
jgi:hypothetical protein